MKLSDYAAKQQQEFVRDVQAYNENHDAAGRFAAGSSGGGGSEGGTSSLQKAYKAASPKARKRMDRNIARNVGDVGYADAIYRARMRQRG